MPELNFNDGSWEPGWLSLYGWIYPTKWANADNELRNAIKTTYQEARDAVGRLGPYAGELKLLLEQWRQKLKDYRRSIAYREADAVLTDLSAIRDRARQQYETDRQLSASTKKPAAKAAPPRLTAPESDSSDSETDDDLAFAKALSSYSKQTAEEKPSKVKPVRKPYVPPTPAEIWRDRQRTMANQCDNGIQYGEHAVNQASVLAALRLAPTENSVFQYRPGPENGHIRIMRSHAQQFWTNGLTHQAERDAGRFMVYRRDGQGSRFVHVSGLRHPDEHP